MNRTHPLFIFFAFSVLGLAACGAPPDRTTSRAVSSSSALVGTDCTCDADCDATEYCATPEGVCGGTGTCTSRGINVLCVGTVQPVCGCDGATYQNSCYAQKAGVSLLSDGACDDGSSDDAGTD